MGKLKIGFIGGGINSAVGHTHRIAAELDGRWQLTAGCFSKDAKINADTAALWNVDMVYSNWQDMLAKEEGKLDAVTILTPTNVHYEMVKHALKAGHNVICEKTLTNTWKEAQDLEKVVDETGKFLTVINNYTGYPMLRELKYLVAQGSLGSIQHIEAEMPQEGFIRLLDGGNRPQPQAWRLQDGPVPTIYLDLGIHLYHIIDFVCGVQHVKTMSALQGTGGFFKEIVDNVSSVIRFDNGVSAQLWFSKLALGYRNGLRIRVFGDEASAEWHQMDAEFIKVCNKKGKVSLIDRASPDMQVATQPRYNRFKSGHPAGFIEAFANYYFDMADGLETFKKTGNFDTKWILSVNQAASGMRFLHQMAQVAI